VPMLMGRMHQYGLKNIAEIAPNGIEYELKRRYYAIAGTAYRPAIATLTSLVPTTQILFGNDDPFVPFESVFGATLYSDNLRMISEVTTSCP